jgi:hypothetical protein
MCTPVWSTSFANDLFEILNTSLAFAFSYCSYKYIVAQSVALQIPQRIIGLFCPKSLNAHQFESCSNKIHDKEMYLDRWIDR